MAAHHDSHHGAAHDAHGPADHGSFQSYLLGFGLSVILTVIPFWLVMGDVLENPRVTGLVITGFAAVQIVVHMIYFLHMNLRAEGGWLMMALIFTIILVVITLVGSLWVMFNLNYHMMPGAHEMTDMF